LNILRSDAETLMILLEAFIYDPLVDWTSTHDFGTAANLRRVRLKLYGRVVDVNRRCPPSEQVRICVTFMYRHRLNKLFV